MKDARTVTALPDGSIYVNRSGNSGMATAGAGDVLTGIVAALAAQEMCIRDRIGIHDPQQRRQGGRIFAGRYS